MVLSGQGSSESGLAVRALEASFLVDFFFFVVLSSLPSQGQSLFLVAFCSFFLLLEVVGVDFGVPDFVEAVDP